MDLKNKNVLVTGSTRGIGLAIAKRFSQTRCERDFTWALTT